MKDLIHDKLTEIELTLNQQEYVLAYEYVEWMNEKANIKYNKKMSKISITNNYIYWCNLGINIGSEQNKIRPVLIIKTQLNSPICTILPLTSERLNDNRWYHIDLETQNSTILVEQLRNISKLRIIAPQRLKGNLCKINNFEWERINEALKKFYCMIPLK